MYAVFIEKLEFYGYHGVTREEQAIGHRYSVTARLEVDGRADRTDRVEDTVDYGEVAAILIDVGEGEPVLTVERVARLMAERLFKQFRDVASAEIEVAKIAPPFPAVAEKAGVVFRFER